MKKQQLVAIGILVLVIVWIIVPRSEDSSSSEAETTPLITAVADSAAPADTEGGFVVRAARLSPQSYIENVRIRGRTQAFRKVDVRAEQAGRIVAAPVARGARVKAGDSLCEIAVDNREADLNEATSRRQQALLEYTAAQDLKRQNLLSDVAVAQAKTAYDSATAAVDRAGLALANTHIRAPFDGVVEARAVELGDLLERGGICATVLDADPMLLVGLVSENDIGKLTPGAAVTAQLLTGESVDATLTYLSRAADPQSRSYRMEAEVTTGGLELRDGITAEILVAASQITAHQIPASALTLDDNGNVGVKILDANNVVQFARVEIVGDDPAAVDSGLWVTGLPAQVTLITHGQEIVFPGQRVQADFAWSTR